MGILVTRTFDGGFEGDCDAGMLGTADGRNVGCIVILAVGECVGALVGSASRAVRKVGSGVISSDTVAGVIVSALLLTVGTSGRSGVGEFVLGKLPRIIKEGTCVAVESFVPSTATVGWGVWFTAALEG